MDEQLLQEITEVEGKLGAKGDPATFYSPIEEVGSIERKFVAAVAKGELQNPQAVAEKLAELGKKADALLVDEPTVEEAVNI